MPRNKRKKALGRALGGSSAADTGSAPRPGEGRSRGGRPRGPDAAAVIVGDSVRATLSGRCGEVGSTVLDNLSSRDTVYDQLGDLAKLKAALQRPAAQRDGAATGADEASTASATDNSATLLGEMVDSEIIGLTVACGELYCAEKRLRRPLLSLLDVLSRRAAPYAEGLAEVVNSTLGHASRVVEDMYRANGADKDDIIDRLQCLAHHPALAEALLAVPTNSGVLAALRFLLLLLEDAVRPLRPVSELDAAEAEARLVQGIELAKTMGRCGQTIRGITYLVRLESVRDLMHRAFSDDSDAVSLLQQVLNLCGRVLNADIVHKDVHTQAAIALLLVSACQFHQAADADDADVPGTRLRPGQIGHIDYLDAAFFGSALRGSTGTRDEGDAGAGATAALTVPDLSTLSATARLSIARAVLSTVPQRLLLSVVPPRRTSLMGGPLYDLVRWGCSQPELDIRIYGFQSLETWLTTARSACGRYKMSTVLTDRMTQDILELLLANWEHPSRKVNSMMSPNFKRLLDIREHASDGRAANLALVEQLLSQPSSHRAKYDAVLLILPRVGAGEVLGIQPDLVEQLVAATGDIENVATPAAQLLSSLLSTLRVEMVAEYESVSARFAPASTSTEAASGASAGQAQGKPTKRKKKLKRGSRKADAASGGAGTLTNRERRAAERLSWAMPDYSEAERAMLPAWRALWLPVVAKSLVVEDWRLRSRAATYILPVVVELDRGCLGELVWIVKDGADSVAQVRGLSLDSAVAGDDGTEMEPWERRLWATVQVLKYGRQAGILSASCFGGNLEVAFDGDDAAAAAAAEMAHCDDLDSNQREMIWEHGPRGTAPTGESARMILAERKAAEEFARKSHVVDRPKDARISSTDLLAALTHADRDVRLSALELVCVPRATSTMPAGIELLYVSRAFPATAKTVSNEDRQRTLELLRKFLVRIYEHGRATQLPVAHFTKEEKKVVEASGIDAARMLEAQPERLLEWRQNRACAAFLRWLQGFCIACAYPGAPFERVALALDVLALMIRMWGFDVGADANCPTDGRAWWDPLGDPLAQLRSDATVNSVLNLLVSSWDKMRQLATVVLHRMPAPLPGLESRDAVQMRLRWALRLSSSPRQRECDAGALLIRVLFRRYVRELRWQLSFSSGDEVAAEAAAGDAPTSDPAVAFVNSLVGVVRSNLDELQRTKWSTSVARVKHASVGERSEFEAEGAVSGDLHRAPFVHGLLLATRYIIEDARIDALPVAAPVMSQWRSCISGLIGELQRSLSIGLEIMCVDDEDEAEAEARGDAAEDTDRVDATHENVKGDVGLSKGRLDCRGHLESGIGDESNEEGLSGADTEAGSMLYVAAWLLVKESALCLGKVAEVAPMPCVRGGDPESIVIDVAEGHPTELTTSPVAAVDDDASNAWLLSGVRMVEIGNTLLRSLLTLKHMGCINMVAESVQLISQSFMTQDELHPRLRAQPSRWLSWLLGRISSDEQEFILRRSSGLAFAVRAILRAEPGNFTAVLLPRAVGAMLACAFPHAGDARSAALAAVGDIGDAAGPVEVGAGKEQWHARVHSLNILMALFNDASLADELHSFIARALLIAIVGFSSSAWAVRNSSMMLFSAVINRAVGAKRVADDSSAGNTVTAAQFFARFPEMHGFLLGQLKAATVSEHASSSTTMHPSLYPVLLLLSRLKPPESEPEADTLGILAFVPYLRRCAAQPQHMARTMAARALTALTPHDVVSRNIGQLCVTLPERRGKAPAAVVTGSAGPAEQDHNAVHGVLLQLRELILRFVRTKAGASAGSETGGMMNSQTASVVPFLSTIVWLASDVIASPPVRKATVEIALAWLEVCGEATRDVFAVAMFNACLECCAAEESVGVGGLRVSAARLAVRMLLGEATLGGDATSSLTATPPATLAALMSHDHEEVRAETMLELHRHLASSSRRIPASAAQLLREQLADRIATEDHPYALRDAIQSLALLNIGRYARDTTGAATPLTTERWTLLLAVHDRFDGSDLRSKALLLGGALLRQAVELATEGALVSCEASVVETDDCLALQLPRLAEGLLQRVEEAADANSTVDLRLAAAQSLALSGLLGVRVSAATADSFVFAREVAASSVRSWIAMVVLLQDDDDQVRDAARAAVCSFCGDGARHGPVPARGAGATSAARSVTVSRALELAHNHLTCEFAWHPTYVGFLLSRIDEVADIEEVVGAHAAGSDGLAIFSRKVFEDDPANSHIEGVVGATFAAAHLNSVVTRDRLSPAVVDVGRRWLAKLEVTLGHLCGAVTSTWIGGPTYHAEAFAGLIALLLASSAIAEAWLRGPDTNAEDAAAWRRVVDAAHRAEEALNSEGLPTPHPAVAGALAQLTWAASGGSRDDWFPASQDTDETLTARRRRAFFLLS